MDVKFDVNEGLKNKHLRPYIILFVVFIFAFAGYGLYKHVHVKTPFVEVGDTPVDTLNKTKNNVTVGGDYVNGNKTTTENITNYNANVKDNILDVSKYLDMTKDIWVIIGSNSVEVKPEDLENGFYPLKDFIMFSKNTNDLFKVQISNGKLLLNAKVDGFDEKYVARIVNNKLISANPDAHLYASDRYFELFDEYYVPVLQVEIQKENNSIYFGGAFNSMDGYLIIHKDGPAMYRPFSSPILYMPIQKRDSLLQQYIQESKTIAPIHE